MAKTTRDAEIRMSVTGADESRIDIKKVETAFESLGKEGAKVEAPVVSALQNIQRAVDRYEQKLADGKAVSQREVTVIVQQFARLESAIEQSGMSIGEFPKDVQKALTQAEAHVKGITREFGKMDDAVKDNAANVKIAGDSWPGLGNAIEGVGGKMGAAAAKIGLVTAALAQGWQMGQQFNTFVKTDMSEWDKMLANLSIRLRLVTESAFEGIAALTKTFDAFSRGNLGELRRALGEAATEAKEHVKNVADAFTLTREELIALHPNLDITRDKLGEVTKATKEQTEAAKAQAVATESVVDVQKRVIEAQDSYAKKHEDLQAKIDATTKAIEAETAALTAEQMAAIDAEQGLIQRTSDMNYFGREVDRASEAITKQAAEVEALTQRYGANDPMTRAAIEQQRILEGALQTASSQLERAQGDVQAYGDEQQRAKDAIREHGERVAELTAQQQKQQDSLSALRESTAATTEGLTRASSAASALSESLGKISSPASTTAAAFEKAAEHAPAAAKGFNEIAAAANGASFDGAGKGLSEMATAAERLTSSGALQYVRELASAVEALTEAANRAATAIAAIDAEEV